MTRAVVRASQREPLPFERAEVAGDEL
jgi:hypothetical protein